MRRRWTSAGTPLRKYLARLNGKERGLVEQRYPSKSTPEAFATRCERSAESLRVSLFRVRAGLKKGFNGELAITRSRSPPSRSPAEDPPR